MIPSYLAFEYALYAHRATYQGPSQQSLSLQSTVRARKAQQDCLRSWGCSDLIRSSRRDIEEGPYLELGGGLDDVWDGACQVVVACAATSMHITPSLTQTASDLTAK